MQDFPRCRCATLASGGMFFEVFGADCSLLPPVARPSLQALVRGYAPPPNAVDLGYKARGTAVQAVLIYFFLPLSAVSLQSLGPLIPPLDRSRLSYSAYGRRVALHSSVTSENCASLFLVLTLFLLNHPTAHPLEPAPNASSVSQKGPARERQPFYAR